MFGMVYPKINVSTLVSNTSMALSSADNYLAFGWYQPKSATLARFKFYVATFTGTAASVALTVELYSAPTLQTPPTLPATSLDTTTLAAGSFSSVGWYEAVFTGGITLSPGSLYWVVVKCTSGANYPTIRYQSTFPLPAEFYSMTMISTDSGGSWGTTTAVHGYLVGFSDGSYHGLGFCEGSFYASDDPYANHEIGNKMSVPVDMCVTGIITFSSKSGSGSSVYGKLYYDDSLIAQTITVPALNIISLSAVILPFTTPVKIPKGTNIRYTLTANDGSTTHTHKIVHWIFDTTVASINKPFGGGVIEAKRVSGVWTFYNNAIAQVALLLDNNNPFPQPSINRRQFNNQR